MTTVEAIEKLTGKIQSKDLPVLMKVLNQEQMKHAMTAFAASKSKNTKLLEDSGRVLIKSLSPAQVTELEKIVGKELVAEIKKAVG